MVIVYLCVCVCVPVCMCVCARIKYMRRRYGGLVKISSHVHIFFILSILCLLPADARVIGVLDVSAYGLTTVPREITDLTNLTYLKLDKNRLMSFPPEMGQLVSLTELSASGNKLIMLPPELGECVCVRALAPVVSTCFTHHVAAGARAAGKPAAAAD